MSKARHPKALEYDDTNDTMKGSLHESGRVGPGGVDEPPARIYELRHGHPVLYYDIFTALGTETKRKILFTLVYRSGSTTYVDLCHELSVSERTVKKHTSDLVEQGVLDRTDTNPAVISFRTDVVNLLVRDALAFAF